MTTIIERRAQNEKTVLFVCDVSPPRGTEPHLLEPVRSLNADFFSVAYNPGRSVRVNSTLAALWLQQNTGIETIFNLATRDMNKLAIQSLLLGSSLMGLENVLVIGGDRFSKRELEIVKLVNDFSPTELLASISSMNDGLDFKNSKMQSPSNICAGATIDLGQGVDHQIELTLRKVEAGAQYFLMQPIYNPNHFSRFLDIYGERHGQSLTEPVFCGIQIMTEDSVIFSDVPEWVTDDLKRGRNGEEIAIQILHDTIDAGYRSIYLIAPVLKGGRRDYEAAQRVIESFNR